ncbi:MAG TPA: heavy metal-binding domain-containing protein [Vicinamibacterales bacterium]
MSSLLCVIATVSASQELFYCPMHPDVTATAPGTCVRCGMKLVAGDPYDLREYRLAIEMNPRAPRAGVPVRIAFTVRHPSTREIISQFAEVHAKPFHLFVLSQDLDSYQHVHPEPQRDGRFAINVTLPRPGYYRLFADFLPIGGAPQVISTTVVTAGFDGDLAGGQAHLRPDTVFTRTVDDVTMSLKLPEEGLVAGREETLRFSVADTKTGQPATDLEPYLAAFGHTLVMSADTLKYIHAHPVELLPETNPEQGRGGPGLTFKAMLPQPGLYRMWTQVQRHGKVVTVPFTVTVGSQPSR